MRSAMPAISARGSVAGACDAGVYREAAALATLPFPLAIVRPTESLRPRSGDVVPGPAENLTTITPSRLEARIKAGTAGEAAAACQSRRATRPVMAGGDPGWFVIRCVYERPECGPLHRTWSATRPRVPARRLLRSRRAGAADPHRPADRHHAGGPAQVRQEHRVHDVGHAVRPDRSA